MIKGYIIAMCGLPGSGKTTTASKLNEKLDVIVLNPHTFRTESICKNMYKNIESRMVNKQWCDCAEDHIVDNQWYACVEEHILNGNSVIMDATFHTRRKREKLYQFSNRVSCNLLFIHCICDKQTVISRLRLQETLGKKIFYDNISKIIEAYDSTCENILEDPQKPPILEYNTKIIELKKYNFYDLNLFSQIVRVLLQ